MNWLYFLAGLGIFYSILVVATLIFFWWAAKNAPLMEDDDHKTYPDLSRHYNGDTLSD